MNRSLAVLVTLLVASGTALAQNDTADREPQRSGDCVDCHEDQDDGNATASWCDKHPDECEEAWQECGNATSAAQYERCRQAYCDKDASACEGEDVRDWCRAHPTECRELWDKCQKTNSTEERERCRQAYCERDPGHKVCHRPPGNVTHNASRNDSANHTFIPVPLPCPASGERDSLSAACRRIDDHRAAAASMDWVAYSVDDDGMGIQNVTIRGRLVLASLHYSMEAPQPPSVLADAQNNRALVRFSDGAALILNDQSRGFLVFRGTGDGILNVTVPDGATVRLGDGQHVRIAYGDGHVVEVAGSDIDATSSSIATKEFVSMAVRAPTDDAPAAKPRPVEVQRAIEKSHVAAEVAVRPAATDGAEVFVYDEVNVTVDVPPTRPTPEAPLRITVGAELEEGRTIVIDLDQETFLGQELELRYFDVNDDGTETEVIFRQAADLADILDPTDDEGQPEWWLVQDSNGIQLMASVPHWSVHSITVASLGELIQEHSVVVGLLVGTSVSVLASAALYRPRRNQDAY